MRMSLGKIVGRLVVVSGLCITAIPGSALPANLEVATEAVQEIERLIARNVPSTIGDISARLGQDPKFVRELMSKLPIDFATGASQIISGPQERRTLEAAGLLTVPLARSLSLQPDFDTERKKFG
jgi:hypothetical protein